MKRIFFIIFFMFLFIRLSYSDDVLIQIRFSEQLKDKDGKNIIYNDVIYLTQEQYKNISLKEINDIKSKKCENFVNNINNQTVEEPTIDEYYSVVTSNIDNIKEIIDKKKEDFSIEKLKDIKQRLHDQEDKIDVN